MSGVLGVPGQGAYAAANAFLDGFAMQRRHHRRAGQSLGWGAWGERGMGAALGTDRLGRAGMTPLSPAEATAWFGRALVWPGAYRAIAALDWQRYVAAIGALPPLLGELANSRSTTRSVS